MLYLAALIVLLLCMVTLDARFRLFVFRRPAAAIVVLLSGTVFFLIWDVAGISQGVFVHLDSQLMTGVMVGPQLPLEEVFFLLFLCYQTMILVTGIEKWRIAREST